jgi:hypothetical protein
VVTDGVTASNNGAPVVLGVRCDAGDTLASYTITADRGGVVTFAEAERGDDIVVITTVPIPGPTRCCSPA